MMPNAELSLLALMDLKYEVNTNTKQRRIKVKQINKLSIKEIKSQKSLDKRKHEIFILVRSSWPTSSPQATRLRFSFILILYTQNHNHAHHLTNPLCQMCTPSLKPREQSPPCTTFFTPRRPSCTMIFEDYNTSYKPWYCVWTWTRSSIGDKLQRTS